MADKTITLSDGRVAVVKEISIRALVDDKEQIGFIPEEQAAEALLPETDEIVAKAFYDPSAASEST